jgi:hypothetical protein
MYLLSIKKSNKNEINDKITFYSFKELNAQILRQKLFINMFS